MISKLISNRFVSPDQICDSNVFSGLLAFLGETPNCVPEENRTEVKKPAKREAKSRGQRMPYN